MTKELYLGVGRTDITPEIGARLYGYTDDTFSESVNDNLTATAFVLESGDVKVALISVTVCLIKTELATQVRKAAAELLSIPIGNCILSTTHTHSGPCTNEQVGWGAMDWEYINRIFEPRILEAVQQADAQKKHVKLGMARGISYVGVNRRELDMKNKIRLGQNPWGPFNPNMTVLSFQGDNGKIVANIIHYGAHCTAAGRNHEITRDWAGVMIDRLETISGGVTAFFNGAEGDVGPRLSNGQTACKLEYAVELGGIAAADAVRIYRDIKVWQEVDLQCFDSTIKIPYEPRMSFEEAKERLAVYQVGKDNWTKYKKYILEQTVASYENGYVDEEYQEIPQSIVRLGDIAIVGFPYEIFSEISMRIEKASPVPYVLALSNANGSEGYFVTQDAICRGGYEVEMFKIGRLQPYADDADYHMVKETIRNLEEMTCTE